MGEGKWIKTYVNSYDDTPSKMIDAREDRDIIHYIRGRINALAGKVNRNGELYMTETKPYTIKTLAIEFNRDFEAVKEAIKVLKNLEVIEVTEDRVFKISDWEMEQNVEGLERIRRQTSERVAKHRAAKKLQEGNNKQEESSGKNEDEKKKPENGADNDEHVNEIKEEVPENYGGLNNGNNQEGGQELIEIQEGLNKKNNIDNDDDINKFNKKDKGLEKRIINNVELNDEINNKNEVTNNSESNNEINNKINNNTEMTESNNLNCNVTVTKQNKRRGKKRSKKKDKKESKKKENNSLIEFSCDNNDFEINDDNGEDLFSESFVTEDSCFDDYIDDGDTTTFFDVSANDKPNEQAVTCFEMNDVNTYKEESTKSFEAFNVKSSNEQSVDSFEVSDYADKTEESAKSLFKYCEDTKSIPGNITISALKYAIDTHTEKYVKMAIDKSIEAGKFNMAYINGILKNWKIEGYPRDEYGGGSINGTNSYGKSTSEYTSKFEGFKPKEPRKLTEREREIAEKNLI